MRYIIWIFILILGGNVFGQQGEEQIDLKYLEDQFYLGTTYNIVLNKPTNVSQRNFSYGLMGGFIKDIPVNRNRNVGFGLGFGYAYNNYYTNLLAVESTTGIDYIVLDDDVSYKRNKVDTHVLEFPIEFRWRTSTPTDYKFWRVYAGMKLGYVLGARSKFVSSDDKIAFKNNDIEKFRYGVMLNFGYSTFNVHLYYALNNLFKDGISTVEGEAIEFTPFRLGIIFYIL
ncbi:porin family protein [Eudoraea chungangensis]|uniref:porin family protein n=1 Tax=Eudoraea chungangensis TaxID=1481905 RepID=UPI0023ED8858|nr:porin family protein [Eudoraea chungangensis]